MEKIYKKHKLYLLSYELFHMMKPQVAYEGVSSKRDLSKCLEFD